jgi:hypothetical protein
MAKQRYCALAPAQYELIKYCGLTSTAAKFIKMLIQSYRPTKIFDDMSFKSSKQKVIMFHLDKEQEETLQGLMKMYNKTSAATLCRSLAYTYFLEQQSKN